MTDTNASKGNGQTTHKRIALVTGASRGLGREVALALAKQGNHVVITGRTMGALEELDDAIQDAGGNATILRLDMRNGELIDQLGPTLFERWGKLDVFVANAAMLGALSPLGHVTADMWANVINTNLNANWRLVRTLDPLLRRSDSGRVVFVTSGAASGRNAYWGPYAVSKAGLEALAHTYAAETADGPVRVNIVNPGAMQTGMRAKAFPGEDPDTLPHPSDVAPMIAALTSPDCERHDEVMSYRDWQRSQSQDKPSDAPQRPQA